MKVSVSKPLKLVYLVIGILCLMLGVIGLIIPVIPGVIFLMAALYLLSRGSRRFKKFSETHPHMQKLHGRMDRMSRINYLDRARVAALITLEAGAKGLQVLFSTAARIIPNRNKQGTEF